MVTVETTEREMMGDADREDRLLSPAELGEYLGIPVQTIYQWRHRGEGPLGYRVGRHVRYRWADIQGWLADQADSRSEGVDALVQ